MEYSVIIPAYNAETTLKIALDSVARQDFDGPLEIVLVNDGSTDNTSDVARNWALENPDSGLKIIEQSNHGLGHARNTAIDVAKYDYLALLDADDRWDRRKLRAIDDLIEEESGIASADVIYHAVFEWDEKSLRRRKFRPFRGLEDFLIRGNPLVPSALIMRRDVFGEFSFEERRDRVEDLGLWIDMLRNGRSFYAFDRPLTYYRMGSGVTRQLDDHLRKVQRVLMEALEQGKIENALYRRAMRRKFLEAFRQSEKSGNIYRALKYLGKAILFL